ncbi:MAG TPA: hypothetical protein VJ770_23920 [Stellaceae bacterium]|nr:hypothetical protein [Stellaceae bacterium]
MAVRFIVLAAALALGAAAADAQMPQSPATPGNPGMGTLPPPGPAGLGAAHRQPTQSDVRQGNDADTRRIQSETDELYQEIMRRSAPPAAH